MKLRLRFSVIAMLLATSTQAQQPPDVVVSDTWANTAMGTGVLVNLTPNSCLYCGIENTAAGENAMESNTSGGGNVAMGFLAMQFNISGHNNTAVGDSALQANTTGYYNTAFGSGALLRSTTAYNNTGIGLDTLIYNTTGGNNTALGANALFSNTTAGENTAVGYNALYTNTTGSANTASGSSVLYSNTIGYQNTATGYQALYSNTEGNHNTVSGFEALYFNTSGDSNTADGDLVLYNNTTGYHNTASGSNALFSNTVGITNVAFGLEALYSNTTGSNNIALGTNAGYYLTRGSNNIEIGNQGLAADSGVIRIGTSSPSRLQTVTYIAGIYGTSVSGSPVFVAANGQLGTVVSSERFKKDVEPMGSITSKLAQLRPVSFKLKSDATGARQYGLIAEEVARVFPELVIRDEKGRIDGVRYDELAPMLLNETQHQAARIRELEQQVSELNDLRRRMAAIPLTLQQVQRKNEH